MSEESRDWLQVGAEVATMRSTPDTRDLRLSKVAKIGKRDVVLEDGQRFNVRWLERREGGSWGWTTRLMPADAPIVAKVQAEARHRQRLGRAQMACEHFAHPGRGRNVTAADAILALAPLTGVEAEIRALFREPR